MTKKIIAVAGPTASGKTALAIELAKRFSGEVVSCDSMQIYKGMDVGTAKPDADEMCGIPHHMIDIAVPDKRFSVAEYCTMARDAIDHILSRGRLPILAGGTGLYMDSVLNNTDFKDFQGDKEFCAEMQRLAGEKGNTAVHRLLEEKDAVAAQNIHPNNLRRVIRALEVCHVTGKTFTQVNAESIRKPVYDALVLGIETDRQLLYQRIDRRVDIMLEKGLLDEVKELKKAGIGRDTTAMQAIGYKELLDFLEGEISFDGAVDKIKQESRRYAKRQLTWFRRNPDINWVSIGDEKSIEEIIERCKSFLNS